MAVYNPSAAQVELVYQWDSQICENTLYFDVGVVPGSPELVALASFVRDWWDANVKPLVSNSVQLISIKATSLQSASAPGIEFTTGLPITGTKVATPALPNNVTCTVTFLTALRGRSYRGRNYVVGLTEGDVGGNRINGALATQYRNAYIDLQVDAAVEGTPWCVYSRYTNGGERAVGVLTPVTGVKVDETLDSQRRRLPGRGT